MSKEYLATKLISGRAEASLKTQWWPRHSRLMARYLTLSLGGGGAAQKSVQELLISGCKDWEVTVLRSSKPGFMEEHAGYEIELVGAVVKGDLQAIERIGGLLVENVRRQTELYMAKSENFPGRTWLDLFSQHGKLFVEAVQWHMSNDDRNFEECERRRQQNTLALAAFTTEWL